MRFDKGIWLPTKRAKAKIGFHGFISRTKVRMKDDILVIINQHLEGHITLNMFRDTKTTTTFFSAM